MRAPCSLLILFTHLAFRQKFWESQSGSLLLQLTRSLSIFLVDVTVTGPAAALMVTEDDRLAAGRERAVAVIKLLTIVAAVFWMAEQLLMFPFASTFVIWPP